MAKTYIYGPQELDFIGDRDNPGELSAEIDSDITNNVEVGDVVEFNGDQFIVYSTHDELAGNIIKATRNGNFPEIGVDDYISINTGGIFVQFADVSDRPEPGTYTFGVYKEASSGLPGLEDKNVVYEYQLVGNNGIKLILKAFMKANENNAVNIPGYSDMELLVENLLVYHGITGETLTAFRTTTFANDVEKIAWIIYPPIDITLSPADPNL